LCLGVQRVRCFPFKSDKAWKCNPKNYVVVIPPSKFTGVSFAQFDMANASHRHKLWFGRVELFFQCSFRNAAGRRFVLQLALLSCLYDFKCPDAQTILQREGAARMFYVPDTLWRFGRPQARTISVQQRHANKERAQKAANQKRAERMPYTRDKAARRRAMRTAMRTEAQ
jgi:hypothetical protein